MSAPVTRASAIQAIEHMHQHNGPGRDYEAVAMLEDCAAMKPVGSPAPGSAGIGWRIVPVLPSPDQLRAAQRVMPDAEMAKTVYLLMTAARPVYSGAFLSPDPDTDALIESMCLTMRHDFGLERDPASPTGGMTAPERAAMRMGMRQLVEHCFKPAVATALRQQAERFDISTDEWSAEPPTEQAWYWHWHGHPDDRPMPLSVLYSGTAKKCFVTMNMTSSGHAEWCDEFGGFWKRMREPATPETPPKKGRTK